MKAPWRVCASTMSCMNFLRERSDIKVVGASPPEDPGVAHPSQTLVALRTVGRNAQEISALAPDANRPHAVHKIAGGTERPARVATDAADDISLNRVERQRARIPVTSTYRKP